MKSHAAKMIVGFGLAGFASGILALLCMPIVGPTAPGLTFGLTIAVFLGLFTRERSVVNALILCVTATTSYVGALLLTIYADELQPHIVFQAPYRPNSYVVLVGGTAGAFCVCAVALFLYSPVRKHIVARAIGCALAGGVLAAAAYGLGSALEGPRPIQGSDFSSGLVTLFLAWPTGMGAVLGVVLQLEPVSRDEGYWPGSYSFEARPIETKPTGVGQPDDSQPFCVSFLGWALIGLLCTFFMFYFGRGLWIRHQFERENQLYAEYIGSRPSPDQLPPLEALEPQDVLIVEPIAGTTPRPLGRSLSKSRANKPEFADFRMCYVNLPTQNCGGSPPAVDVEVIQYPTPAWAGYVMRGKAYGSGPGYFQKPHDLVRVGHHIFALENPQEHGHGEYYWIYGSILVTVRSYTSDPNPFVDAYLEKFPSTN
jgi:hypothetical protein